MSCRFVFTCFTLKQNLFGEFWDWEEVVKHPKDLRRSAYSGPGIMTDYLKKVVRNRLSMLGINPDMWVSKSFGEEERKRRERSRKSLLHLLLRHQRKQNMIQLTYQIKMSEEMRQMAKVMGQT